LVDTVTYARASIWSFSLANVLSIGRSSEDGKEDDAEELAGEHRDEGKGRGSTKRALPMHFKWKLEKG